jgi:predicted DNA repair protein MutK
MFMVGGGIVTHGIPGAHDFNHHVQDLLAPLPSVGPLLSTIAPSLLDTIGGVIVGAITVVLWTVLSKVLKRD